VAVSAPPQTRAPGILDQVPDGVHLIGGEWVTAKNGETIAVINPASGELLRNVPRGAAADVADAVDAAARAFPTWRDLSATARANLIRAWGDLCNVHAEDISILECLEVGKPFKGPANVGDRAIYFAGLADKLTGDTLPSANPNVLGITLREPYGVCGSIVPWNFPPHLMMSDVAPAIAAGNTIVVKPPEDAPIACLYLAKLAKEAGIPDGVINVVTGYGGEAGSALPLHPLVRHMSFTGSPETGSKVMQACATRLIPLHLELGGKSPQVVLRDADLEAAVPHIVRNFTTNAGQVCVAGTRLVVDQAVRAQIVEAVAAEMEKVRVGHWYEDVDMGPLISKKQENRVMGYMDVAQQEGVDVVVGGNKLGGAKFDHGFFVEPTLFDNVKPDMRVAQEEIFGPVLSVIEFTDVDEAVAIANGTRYGLGASVWTRDIKRAIQLARSIESGQVYVNQYGSGGVIGAPFGGYKNSGFGRTGSADTILEYTQIKAVVFNAGQ
jgi:acyl-CoA reductase-like NAD-dependent aldehyde dehydrogenase